MKTDHLIAIALLLSLPIPSLTAQPSTELLVEKMKPLEWMLGTWQGPAWIEMEPNRRIDFQQREVVQRKVGGWVYQIDGIGRMQIPGQDTQRVVHQALGLVSYDAGKQTHRFRAFTDRGYFQNAAATVTPDSLIWGFEVPGYGQVRYTSKQTKAGEWHEIGERSADGKEWKQFFEMTLQRQPENRTQPSTDAAP